VWELCLELAKMVFKSEKKVVLHRSHSSWFKPLRVVQTTF
jgi:hypothetical protein